MSLDKDDPNPAYRLGRLFAILEKAQRAALGSKVNSTIRDKYFGAASATPGLVFPSLLRGAQNHIASVRKNGSKAAPGGVSQIKGDILANWFDKQIGEILGGFGAEMPRTFRIEDQGRFAIGYYHQRYTKKQPKEVMNGDAAVIDDAAVVDDASTETSQIEE